MLDARSIPFLKHGAQSKAEQRGETMSGHAKRGTTHAVVPSLRLFSCRAVIANVSIIVHDDETS